jgi:leader peptidase (prepilin peptidase)/N-methyltransferase
LGGIIFGKEAMGMGDIKFTGAIGLYFGTYTVSEISFLSFLIAAIFSIFILIFRLITKNKDEYIPFGPFLALSAMFCVFIPVGSVFENFLLVCKIISESIPFV